MNICPCCGQEIRPDVVRIFASGASVTEASRLAGVSYTTARAKIHKACIDLAGGIPEEKTSHFWSDGRRWGKGIYPNTQQSVAKAWRWLLVRQLRRSAG